MDGTLQFLITWSCLGFAFIFIEMIKKPILHKNRMTYNGSAFIVYSILTATAVYLWDIVPMLFPNEKFESNYIFPTVFLILGLSFFIFGLNLKQKKQ